MQGAHLSGGVGAGNLALFVGVTQEALLSGEVSRGLNQQAIVLRSWRVTGPQPLQQSRKHELHH